MVKSRIISKTVKGRRVISDGKPVTRKSTRSRSSGGGQVAAETTNVLVQITDTRTGKTTTTRSRVRSSSLRRAQDSAAKEKVASQSLAELQKTRGLQAKIVDIKTGKEIQAGRFKLDKAAERRISDIVKREKIKEERLFQERGAGGLLKVLTPQQRQQVYRSLANTSYAPLPPLVRQKFREIDAQRGTTFLQKEEQKRRLAGISSGDPRGQGFFRAPSPNEAREMLNTLKPSDFKTGVLSKLKKIVMPLGTPPEIIKKLNKFNNYLEKERQLAIRGNDKSQAVLAAIASVPTNFLESFADIYIGVANTVLNPIDTYNAIKNLKLNDIKRAVREAKSRIKAGDPGVYTDIAAEILTLKFGLGIVKGAKAGSQAAQKLRPSFVKAATKEGDFFVIRKSYFKSAKEFLTGKQPELIKLFKRDAELILKSQSVKTGSKPLSQQARLAGKVVTAVNASADQLTSLIRRKKLIRKPFNLEGASLKKKFPKGEASFPSNIKSILNKFDEGTKLTRKEFAKVNLWLRKNVADNITLLERSLYLDPASGVRVSRLGITKQSKIKNATFKDILKGNFKLFDRSKPQVLIFQNAQVAKFPKSLKGIEKKLKSGKKLTTAETNQLIAWQVETGSGKFKPVGSTIFKGGAELEVTLAPGELIKRVKQVGFTFIEGKKVTFVTAEVYKPTKTITDKLKKAQTGKLTDKQVLALEKDLSKKLGRKLKVETPTTKSRAIRQDVPVLRLDAKGLRVLRPRGRAKPAKRTRTTTKRPTTKRVTTPRKTTRVLRAPTKRPKAPRTTRAKGTRTTTRAPRTTRATTKPPRPKAGRAARAPSKVARPPKRPIPKLSLDSKSFSNKVLTFEGTFRERKNKLKPAGKSNPVISKTIKIRDTKNRALKKVISRVDNTLVRSLQLKVVGVGQSKKDINVPSAIKKFRVKKSTNTPVLKLVEKSKNAFDRPSEKREAKLARKRKK